MLSCKPGCFLHICPTQGGTLWSPALPLISLGNIKWRSMGKRLQVLISLCLSFPASLFFPASKQSLEFQLIYFHPHIWQPLLTSMLWPGFPVFILSLHIGACLSSDLGLLSFPITSALRQLQNMLKFGVYPDFFFLLTLQSLISRFLSRRIRC